MSTLFDDSFPLPSGSPPAAPERPRSRPSAAAGPPPCSTGSTPSSGRPSCTRAARCSSWPGAGSGKTRVLTHRIAYLLGERKVHPRRGAGDHLHQQGRRRDEGAGDRAGRRPRQGDVGDRPSTRACVRILRREAAHLGMKSTFSIYDQADSQRLMTLVCRDLDLDPKRYPPRSFSAQVSNLKNELVDHETFAGPGRDAPGEDAGRGLRALPAAAARGQRVRLRRPDHDDGAPAAGLPRRGRALPAPVPPRAGRRVPGHQPRAVRAGAASSSPAATRALGVPPAELCVVGDADQSIYAFRGATIRNILDFEQDYPDATTILLEQNYRSTQTILSAANAVISRNASRKPKNLWSDAGRGRADRRLRRRQRARRGRRSSPRRSTGSPTTRACCPSQVAVFYRTNAQSRVFEEVFIRVGLPYKVVGGVRFYERREVRDALAYLRVLANPADTVSLRRILNVPKRGIGDRCRGVHRGARASASRSPSTTRCSGARTPTGWPPGRCRRSRGSGP